MVGTGIMAGVGTKTGQTDMYC